MPKKDFVEYSLVLFLYKNNFVHQVTKIICYKSVTVKKEMEGLGLGKNNNNKKKKTVK